MLQELIYVLLSMCTFLIVVICSKILKMTSASFWNFCYNTLLTRLFFISLSLSLSLMSFSFLFFNWRMRWYWGTNLNLRNPQINENCHFKQTKENKWFLNHASFVYNMHAFLNVVLNFKNIHSLVKAWVFLTIYLLYCPSYQWIDLVLIWECCQVEAGIVCLYFVLSQNTK